MRIDTAGNVYLGGEKVTDQLAKELKQEANIMKELRLWNILTNTPKHQAKEVMFTKSKTFDDMMAGKMMLYTVDVQENIVNRLTRL